MGWVLIFTAILQLSVRSTMTSYVPGPKIVWMRFFVPAAGGLEAVVAPMQTPASPAERGGCPRSHTCWFSTQCRLPLSTGDLAYALGTVVMDMKSGDPALITSVVLFDLDSMCANTIFSSGC